MKRGVSPSSVALSFRVRFTVWGFYGFKVQGLGMRAQGLGFRVHGLRFRISGLGIRVQCLSIRCLCLSDGVYMYVGIHLCVYVYIYIYIYMYTCILNCSNSDRIQPRTVLVFRPWRCVSRRPCLRPPPASIAPHAPQPTGSPKDLATALNPKP